MRDTVTGYTSVTERSRNISTQGGKVTPVLMPVWLITTEKEGKTYTFAINGQTGRLAGELPVDKRKYRRLKLSWMLGLEVALALLIAFFL